MELDFNQILGYQKNRPPYLMIDHVTNVVPGVSCSGYKILKPDEWFSKYIGKMTRICLVCYK